MALFAPNPSQQRHLRSTTMTSLCKCSSSFSSFFQFHSSPSHSLPFPPPKRNLQTVLSPPLIVRNARNTHSNTNLSTSDRETATRTTSGRNDRRNSTGFSSFRDKDKRVDKKSLTKTGSSVVDESSSESINSGNRRKMGSGFSSDTHKDENLVKKLKETIGTILVKEDSNRTTKKGVEKRPTVKKTKRRPKKVYIDLEGGSLRVGLDMCSKKGDAMGALELYDSAQREGTTMGQYQYSVLLYLCSSAATGVVRPAKSGSVSRSLSKVNSTSDDDDVGNDDEDIGNDEDDDDVGNDDSSSSLNGKKLAPVSNGLAKPNPKDIDGRVQVGSSGNASGRGKDVNDPENGEIRVSEEFKKYALQRGFEIYEKMCLEKVPMNEAILTSIARMALAMGDGDMAFDTVKQMKSLGINPRLRSYGPALSAFCNIGDIEKAFTVEEHMREHGVCPEEPELEALLRLSIEAGRSDKVYYLLHKLRTSVRKVSPSTACLIEKWFNSKVASKVGRRKLDKKSIREAIENGGGGWHGQGWLGKGKWIVSRTCVGDDGLCKACGERLATIDLDPVETEKFAESVASIATKREKNSSFQKFQKWLDYYGPFEAVVDGANVGLFSQRSFKPSKVNAVANGIRQLLPSKRWPLIVLHNRRIVGDHMNKPVNKAHVERWKNSDALYATPTGSNDDWYWLYAAIKFKCLMVTNDEMRDHLFQLLGNDFFPKWKERHQVHFSFSDGGPVFHMPPPCSVVIQESEKGHWHVPVASEHEHEGERTWLCVVRANSYLESLNLDAVNEEREYPLDNKRRESSDSQSTSRTEPSSINQGNDENCERSYGRAQGQRNLGTTSVSKFSTILPQIEAAEKKWSSVIDFQI